MINSYTDTIVQCILDASDNLPKTAPSKGIPKWNEEARPLREKALFWHQLWVDNGKPHTGLIANIMRETRCRYHLKVKQLKRSQEQNKFSKMAEAISSNNERDLWKELKKLNKCPQAACIDGVTGNQAISELFANKYKTVYNSVGYEKDTLENLKATVEELIRNSNDEYQYVSVHEVAKAIAK